MVTPTEINTEQSKHDIAVLVAIVRTADIKATVYQFVQPSALKFVHSIKDSTVGNNIIVSCCYLCHVM